MKIAVVGSGIAGLSCAYRLAQSGGDVTLYEANDYFGGHTHTVDVTLEGITHGVDTGFLVFNHRTYPHLVSLFAELAIDTVATDMSFSVKRPVPAFFGGSRLLEWAGGNLNTVFAQRLNILSPRFLRMLLDIVRFNRQATALAVSSESGNVTMSLGKFLQENRYSKQFRQWYLLPMAGCIWSCPTEQMLEFPLQSFVRFCHNHGLLQVTGRPQWQTVRGGARNYVDKMLAAIPCKLISTPVSGITRKAFGNGSTQVCIESAVGSTLYDHVVLAGHSDQSLAILNDASEAERMVLGAVRYQPNRAVLHTDSSCLPENHTAWSAWNYQSEQSRADGRDGDVCVHYLINQLQPLPFKTPVIVSLNPITRLNAAKVIATYDYAHPVFDAAAVTAQEKLPALQGTQNTWFAGAWTGYGFHEDGLKSGLAVAQSLIKLMTDAELGDRVAA